MSSGRRGLALVSAYLPMEDFEYLPQIVHIEGFGHGDREWSIAEALAAHSDHPNRTIRDHFDGVYQATSRGRAHARAHQDDADRFFFDRGRSGLPGIGFRELLKAGCTRDRAEQAPHRRPCFINQDAHAIREAADRPLPCLLCSISGFDDSTPGRSTS